MATVQRKVRCLVGGTTPVDDGASAFAAADGSAVAAAGDGGEAGWARLAMGGAAIKHLPTSIGTCPKIYMVIAVVAPVPDGSGQLLNGRIVHG